VGAALRRPRWRLNEMVLRTDDGAEGTGIFELTGASHHRYFPVARAERLPPRG